MVMKEQKIDKYLLYDIQRYKETLRAIIWHVEIDDKKNCTLKSDYSVCVNLDTWESTCTCMGFLMRKETCSHLRFLFSDEKYKEMCGEWLK